MASPKSATELDGGSDISPHHELLEPLPGPAQKLTESERTLAAALNERVNALIPFDACIIGTGHLSKHGWVVPDRCGCFEVRESFLDGYGAIAEHDSAAQLFACNQTSVLAISTLTDYAPRTQDFERKPGEVDSFEVVGKYLRDNGIAHLLLCGVVSSRGLAWLTLYRTAGKEELNRVYDYSRKHGKSSPEALNGLPLPFSPAEAEIASYMVRAELFQWQREANHPPNPEPIDPTRYELVRLLPEELDVALRQLRGMTNEEMRDELKRGNDRIAEQRKSVLENIGTVEDIAERLIGPLPPPRQRWGNPRGRPFKSDKRAPRSTTG